MSSPNKTENVRNVLFYFQIHQPRRLRTMRFFDIGNGSGCFNDEFNAQILQRVAKSCYLPANATLLKLIQKHPNIRVAFSVSGITLDQMEAHCPEVIDSLRALADTGCVEFLGETYYHSLACMIPGHELEIQALKHAERIENLFGKRPMVFRNTELLYHDDIGRRIALLGFRGIFTDGVHQILLNRKSAHQLYTHPEEKDLRIFLRNYLLSDDIAFRFNQNGQALTAEKYIGWLSEVSDLDRIINVAIDYETFGEHQKKETGIFEFVKKLFTGIAKNKNLHFVTPSEAIDQITPAGPLPVTEFVSWADRERDLSAWLGNDMQKDSFQSLIKLDKQVKALGDPDVLRQWRSLQTSDHFYYMSTKKGSDGTVHNYFSPYPSPYEAFINFMNVLTDFSCQLDHKKAEKKSLARKTRQHTAHADVEKQLTALQ